MCVPERERERETKALLNLTLLHLLHGTDIGDVETHMAGKLDDIRQWYKVYKVAEGKPENAYAYDGKALNRV